MEAAYLNQLGFAFPRGYAAPNGAWSVLQHHSTIDMALLKELFQRPIPLKTVRSLFLFHQPNYSLLRICFGSRNWSWKRSCQSAPSRGETAL